MIEWLMRTQTDTIVSLMLVRVVDFYPYKTEGTALLLSCKFFESTMLIRSESSAPQLCPALGCPVWLGQDQKVEQ